MATTPFIRGKRGTANGGLMTINADVPQDGTAPLVGDWMLVAINTTAANPTITGPNGWVQVMAPIAMGSRYMSLWRSIRGASDNMLFSYMFMQSSVGAAQALLAYGPGEFSFVGSYLKGASSVTQTTPGVATTKANSLALSFQAEATSATETDSQITVASPFTKDLWTIQSGSPLNSVLLAHRDMPTPGNTGDAVSTWANPTGNRGSIMAVVTPMADASVTRLDAKMADGQGNIVDVGLVGWDGSNEVELSKVEYVYSGTMVPDLDRLNRVWWMTHRGGSLDYQECTLRGYLESAILHADVLEISVAITSDGKIICAHDATADRTSSSVRGQSWRFDQHTWAEVQQLVQDLPNRGDSRFTTDRYYTLDEVIEKFAATHTLMVDPKALNTAARRDVLYPRLQQIADYRRRILGKFYHTGTAIADEFHAIGCKAWGYAYTEAITGLKSDGSATQEPLLSATAAKWDYLGMEYGASAEVWAETVRIAGGKTGKRVIGHIVATVDQADQAVAKGARALQVSGVRAVSAAY